MLSIDGVAVVRGEEEPGESLNELVFRAASGALRDAGLTRADVDGVVLGASDQLDARAISSMVLAGPAGGYLRDEVKVSDEGSLALATAAMKLGAGAGRRSLVVSWTKTSESPLLAALGVNAEPVLSRPAGLHPICVEAAECGLFAHRMGLDAEAVERSAKRMAEAAGRTPEGDELIAWPLRTSSMPPTSDGAVALVVAAGEGDIRLDGWAFASSHPDPTRRPPPEEALAAVAARARAAAGQSRAIAPNELVETTDRNAYRLCISVTGLGLVDGRESADSLAGGELANVNHSGGLWASNPPVAAGLQAVAQAVLQLRAGVASEAVAHSSYGMGGQSQFVAVLRRAA